jgi:ring-1,2-phenylacetyl-CoA epoxidase subunit PaaD
MPTLQLHTEEQIWEFLKEVTDPEIPVLNIVEMGIVRKVDIAEDGNVRVPGHECH